MPDCIAPGCRQRGSVASVAGEVAMFVWPSQERYPLAHGGWSRFMALDRVGYTPSKRGVICSSHFRLEATNYRELQAEVEKYGKATTQYIYSFV